MKKSKYWQTAFLLNLFFLFSCFAPTQISAQTTVSKKLTPREIAQQTLPSTVLLVMGNEGTKKIKSGSGFFVAEDIVATNFHVIKDTIEGYAKIYGQEKIYKVLGTVGIDEKNDLALLKLSGIKGKPLKLNTDDSIAIGDEVFAVGNPEGLEGTFSQGIVSSIRKTDKFNLLQITASISEGSSGGAVLNDKAEVVGVAVGAIESGQSLNFAIPVSFLRSLLAKSKSLVSLTSIKVVEKIKAGMVRKNSIGMEFVYISNGSFEMGSNDGDLDEKPIHRVTISKGFYMGKYEVTQEEFKKVMGTNPSYFENCPRCPVEKVSWVDAQEFIKRLNAKNEGIYRLPTEAEWEYAARAGTTTKWSFGNEERQLADYAWYYENSELKTNLKTHEVGTRKPNQFGLYDMHGNVWEWCADWYGAYPTGNITDPTGPSSGSKRVYRGGSFDKVALLLRASIRTFSSPSYSDSNLGFRMVRNE